MFTWNLQYISKTRLSDTLRQLRIDTEKGDVLIRIHTAIHTKEEAVELASFVKSIVPGAHILGTSTSAVIHEGRLYPDQCLISITQMSEAAVGSVRLALPEAGAGISATGLCTEIRNAIVKNDDAFMLVFFTNGYPDIKRFVDASKDIMPGVRMLGGVAGGTTLTGNGREQVGFVFDEDGWSENGVIAVSINGERAEYTGAVITGVQVVGEELEITDAKDNMILGINGTSASENYREGVGDEVQKRPELALYFPLWNCRRKSALRKQVHDCRIALIDESIFHASVHPPIDTPTPMPGSTSCPYPQVNIPLLAVSCCIAFE